MIPLIAFFILVVAALTQAALIIAGRADRDSVTPWLTLAGTAALLVALALRTVAIGFPALTGTYESLLFYALCASALSGAYGLATRLPRLPAVRFGVTMAALALVAVALSPIVPKELLAPLPALKSAWLALHVSFSFVGEAFFLVSFVAALASLLTKNETSRTAGDRLAYAAICVGYPVFTVGALIFGAVWADVAWGSWWSWDPKETWALVTWLVYTLYLHARLVLKRRGRLTTALAAVAFLFTLFTFFGVNYLLSGLHSYA